MVSLFVELTKMFMGYTAAIIIGGAIACLIGIPVTFLNVWGIMLIMVVSAFIAGGRNLSESEESEADKKEEE